jgi:hypothetical protein
LLLNDGVKQKGVNVKLGNMFLILGLLCIEGYSQVDTNAKKYWMMTYFLNSQDAAGPRLAFSSDSATGLQWQKYNAGAVLFAPVIGGSSGLCRDPVTVLDRTTMTFHMIWTVAWTGAIIGHSTSKDLKTWTTQEAIPVGTSLSAAVCWAPEFFWDDIQNIWMIYWSCEIPGTAGKRIYSVTTNDFKTYSTPKKIFDPGFTIIDGNIFKDGPGSYYMFYKDERSSSGSLVAKNLHYTTATTPQGLYSTTVSQAIASTGTEGPSMVKVGNEYRLYFDPFSTTNTYRMVRTESLSNLTSPWSDGGTLKNGTTNFEYSHCNIIEIPREYVLWMLYKKPLPITSISFMPSFSQRKDASLSLHESENGFIKMYDLSGRLVCLQRIAEGRYTGSTGNNLSAGSYFIKSSVRNSRGQTVIMVR